MVKIGYESLPLALVTAAFIGMVFALQIASEFVRFGAGKFVGGIMSVGMARELGPAVTGIVKPVGKALRQRIGLRLALQVPATLGRQ